MNSESLPVSDTELEKWGSDLRDPRVPLVERFRCLFSLRHAQEQKSIDLIAACLGDPSSLLKHEVCYVLGQKRDVYAVPILTQVLEDEAQAVIVRHEAGEALGSIGDASALQVLKKHCTSHVQEIAETCQLAVRRLEWEASCTDDEMNAIKNASQSHPSVDPAPCLVLEVPKKQNVPSLITQLESTMLNSKESMFDRYKSMFTLRNLSQQYPELCLSALGKALVAPDSALFRHEVAFVLGQLAHSSTTDVLRHSLADVTENGMVRHECAEALGAIGDSECVKILQDYLHDPEPLVRESCVVALDIADYKSSDQFQYVQVPQKST